MSLDVIILSTLWIYPIWMIKWIIPWDTALRNQFQIMGFIYLIFNLNPRLIDGRVTCLKNSLLIYCCSLPLFFFVLWSNRTLALLYFKILSPSSDHVSHKVQVLIEWWSQQFHEILHSGINLKSWSSYIGFWD